VRAGGGRKRLLAAVGQQHPIAVALQIGTDQLADLALVVDDQDRGRAHHPHPAAGIPLRP
jgi:hypothetical protein